MYLYMNETFISMKTINVNYVLQTNPFSEIF